LQYNEEYQSLAEDEKSFDKIARIFSLSITTKEKKKGQVKNTLMSIKKCNRAQL
jgi:hypothetical protein